MDIFEFELRYQSYSGLSTRLDLGWDQETILQACKKTSEGALTKKITECSLEDLWNATRATYTQAKKELIQKNETIIFEEKPVSEYIERLEYEFKVIYEMGYNTYFLIVGDYINWSKDNKIVVGPGRGSCAGSLLSYVVGITDINPLEYDLIFERFLNPGRISMPDIDTDFEDTQRERVIGYIRDTYGESKVANIGTYMTMAAKASFKDVARVYGIKFDVSNKLSALITEKTIQKSVEANKDLQEAIASDSRIEKIIEIGSALEGTVRQTGVHACGMIIAPEDTINYTAIQYPPKSGSKDKRDETRLVSQYEGPTIEEIGLLKMDLLGLRNLSIIKHTIKILAAKAKKDGETLDPLFTEFLDTMLFHPPLDDEYTFKKIFHTGDTSGVFQFESDGMKNWMKKLKPTDFNDLIAMVSLYRPGPMEFIPHYINRKHEIDPVTYMGGDLYSELEQKYGEEVAQEEKKKMAEDLEPFMKITYGIAVYQEQLMRLVQAMAGFSMSEADKLRKGVGKKIREVVEKIKIEFVEKAQTYKNYKPETATWAYEKMVEPAADYSFNKSHAACYAYISYQTAWLKAHYPVEFHAALLRSVEEETDKLAKFIDEVKLQGFTINLPSVNKSFNHVAALDGQIYLGFLSIKGLGSDIAAYIQSERESGGPFNDLQDFLKRTEGYINKKSLEALIKSGALDEFDDRMTLLANVKRILDWQKSTTSEQATGGLFAMEAVEGADLSLTPIEGASAMERLATEFAIFKTFISAHPLDGMYGYVRSKHNFITMFADKENYGEFTIMGFIKSIGRGMRGGFFVKVEDISGEVEFYLNEKLDFKPFDMVIIKGYKSRHAKLDQLMVFTHEELVAKITKAGRYKPEETIAAARKERMLAHSPENPEPKETREQPDAPKEDEPKQVDIPESTTQQSIKTTFSIPETVDGIATLKKIIKQYPGSVPVTIGSMKLNVNDDGLQALHELL